MNSPVSVSIKSFISIDKNKSDAVYLQIVYQFINAIKRRLLEEGDVLPGTRKIAIELGVHRQTVVSAMTELANQGWIEVVPNVGTFINSFTEQNASVSPLHQGALKKAGYSFRKEVVLNRPKSEDKTTYCFTDGTPDYSIIDSRELVRFYAGVLKRKNAINYHSSIEGSPFFQEQLSYYINLTRGFHISRQFLLPIQGKERLLSVLSQLLIQRGDVILVGELSYFLPNMIFKKSGAILKTIPLDKHGIDTKTIEKIAKQQQLRGVYIQPRNHYPTTVQLSNERRQHLIELAQQYHFIIIEDDTDYEFSLEKRKQKPLFLSEGGKNSVYLGGFGTFLTPGFQMNFLIAAKDVIDEAKKYVSLYGLPNSIMEKALGNMIREGDIHRYRRKFQRDLTERKKTFASLLSYHFGKKILFKTPLTGLAFWVEFIVPISLTLLQKKALEKSLYIPTICLFQNQNVCALRLGFAHLSEQEMNEVLVIVAQCVAEVNKK